MPQDEMETHTLKVQCCLPYITFCHWGCFFLSFLYNSLSHFNKEQWKPVC